MTTLQEVDRILADQERRLRDQLSQIIRARTALGVRRGRKPKEA